MAHIKSLLIVFSIVLLTIGSSAYASPAITEEMYQSVFLLSSNRSSSCATGFAIDSNMIVTNAHVTDSLCSYSICDELKVTYSSELDSRPNVSINFDEIKVEHVIPSLDVALLSIKGTTLKVPFPAIGTPSTSKKIFSLGYPRCKRLEESSGEITELNSIKLFTKSKGKHGSSGSPLFNDKRELIGIVDQASSIPEALLSLTFGTEFNIRGTRADVALSLFGQPVTQSLINEAELLSEFYINDLSPLIGFKRIRKSMDFINAAEGFKKRVLSESDDLGALKVAALSGSYLPEIFNLKTNNGTSDLKHAAEKLAISHSLEIKGPFQQFIKPIDPEAFQNVLFESSRTPEQINELLGTISDSSSNGFIGFELYMLSRGLVLLAILLVINGIWGWTIGYTYTVAAGSRIKRFLVSILVGVVLWPLSLLSLPFIKKRTKATSQKV